ncbi:MAG: ATP-binding cassette domain-containing protein, partial [Nitrospinota bacterium]|nr:ATP-binding cassette domain-containing protein [Nitrospinota bacterium]
SVKVLSGGERSRVLLGKILANPANLLLLDEPTNHLDMESIEELTEQLDEYEGAVIIVTHSEMILRDIATKLIVFSEGKAQLFMGGYDDFLEKIGWEDEPRSKKKESRKKEKEEPVEAKAGKPAKQKKKWDRGII